jgi:hypothetical protein
MDKILIRTHDWRRWGAARTIVYAAGLLMILAAAPAATAASACKQSITACECVLKGPSVTSLRMILPVLRRVPTA